MIRRLFGALSKSGKTKKIRVSKLPPATSSGFYSDRKTGPVVKIFQALRVATPAVGAGTRNFFCLFMLTAGVQVDLQLKLKVTVLKVSKDIRLLTTTQSNLARAFGLTQPRISQLIELGLVVRDEKDPMGGVKIFESTKLYYGSKAAAEDGDGTLDLIAEKARHEKVKREQSEIKLRQLKGELYEAETVERAIIEILAMLRTHLTALPAKLATLLEGKSRDEVYRVLTNEIEERLEEIARSFEEAEFAEEADST